MNTITEDTTVEISKKFKLKSVISKDSSRSTSKVRIENGKAIATDGKMMAIVPTFYEEKDSFIINPSFPFCEKKTELGPVFAYKKDASNDFVDWERPFTFIKNEETRCEIALNSKLLRNLLDAIGAHEKVYIKIKNDSIVIENQQADSVGVLMLMRL